MFWSNLDENGDGVLVTGVKGYNPSDSYKVSATYLEGYRATAVSTIAGRDAVAKGRRTAESQIKRWRSLGWTFSIIFKKGPPSANKPLLRYYTWKQNVLCQIHWNSVLQTRQGGYKNDNYLLRTAIFVFLQYFQIDANGQVHFCKFWYLHAYFFKICVSFMIIIFDSPFISLCLKCVLIIFRL